MVPKCIKKEESIVCFKNESLLFYFSVVEEK